jgi:hypothetical protein
VFSGVGVEVRTYTLKLMKVKRSNVQLSVNAFGYASHFGMAVPIKLHAVGDQDEE